MIITVKGQPCSLLAGWPVFINVVHKELTLFHAEAFDFRVPLANKHGEYLCRLERNVPAAMDDRWYIYKDMLGHELGVVSVYRARDLALLMEEFWRWEVQPDTGLARSAFLLVLLKVIQE